MPSFVVPAVISTTAPSATLPNWRRLPGAHRLYDVTFRPHRKRTGRGELPQFRHLPSDRSVPHTPGGSWALHFQVLHAVRGLRRDTRGSAPPCPLRAALTGRQDLRHATDRSVAPSVEALDAGLRHQGFPDAASLLPGSLVITWAGLTPAGRRQLTTHRGTSGHATTSPTYSACLLGTLCH